MRPHDTLQRAERKSVFTTSGNAPPRPHACASGSGFATKRREASPGQWRAQQSLMAKQIAPCQRALRTTERSSSAAASSKKACCMEPFACHRRRPCHHDCRQARHGDARARARGVPQLDQGAHASRARRLPHITGDEAAEAQEPHKLGCERVHLRRCRRRDHAGEGLEALANVGRRERWLLHLGHISIGLSEPHACASGSGCASGLRNAVRHPSRRASPGHWSAQH